MSTQVFVLSPASLRGARAAQLASPRAAFAAAAALRSPDGVAIAVAFAFVSALYFRGKLAYARRFGGDGGVHVIAPGYGLVPPEWRIDGERWRRLRRTPADARRPVFREPLRRDARTLAAALPADGAVVLLGSVATGKYVDVLAPELGPRLVVPRCFVGLGDMARGARLLAAVRAGEPLATMPVAELPRPPRPIAKRPRRGAVAKRSPAR